MITRPLSPFKRTLATMLTLALAGEGCGVEVGNPHGSKGGTSGGTATGSVSMVLADAPLNNLKHVYLNLVGLSVLDLDGNSYPLTLATTGQVDALALQNGTTLPLASGASLPVNDYGAIVLQLDSQNPASLVNADGTTQPLPLSDGADSIYVEQAFSVTSDTPLSLVFHIDLRSSLRQLTGGKSGYSFGPQASVLPNDVQATLQGNVNDTTFDEVCVYLQLSNSGFSPGGAFPSSYPGGGGWQHGYGGGGGGDNDGGGWTPPAAPDQSITARLPPSFGQGAQITYDTTPDCDNASTSAAVTGGSFSLQHLWPGSYFMRFFRADGTYADGPATGVALSPGQDLTLTVIAGNTSGSTSTAGSSGTVASSTSSGTVASSTSSGT